ncbi:hypothetical protein QFW96_02225 [Saccharopolyspora sp. TS4A08]|uniref:Uncharacterized protein n=1 Tax=Saccharopolyspora ipomoeae TaxID=3042027 RepID=A0ABT6PHG8_9PSEU|nr:hypothetical protein [Saccharopolyspora sp. TS4A08]MDI2027404.1 hypothetical protein [Saccharopolyspora sp. TS4A08]
MPMQSATPARRRWLRVVWIATFTPICAGLLIAGLAFHWAFLPAAVLWFAALGCVLRMESLDHRTRSAAEASPRQQLAKAGWLLLAIVLITTSAVVVNAVLG